MEITPFPPIMVMLLSAPVRASSDFTSPVNRFVSIESGLNFAFMALAGASVSGCDTRTQSLRKSLPSWKNPS